MSTPRRRGSVEARAVLALGGLLTAGLLGLTGCADQGTDTIRLAGATGAATADGPTTASALPTSPRPTSPTVAPGVPSLATSLPRPWATTATTAGASAGTAAGAAGAGSPGSVVATSIVTSSSVVAPPVGSIPPAPAAPGAGCAVALPSGGSGRVTTPAGVSCPDAQAILKAYLAAPDDGSHGNTKSLLVSGWICQTPTAGEAHQTGVLVTCAKADQTLTLQR